MYIPLQISTLTGTKSWLTLKAIRFSKKSQEILLTKSQNIQYSRSNRFELNNFRLTKIYIVFIHTPSSTLGIY
ncbi:unnamed protein product [Rhizophagus irregularis]|nr:unnamed protein product [Rhizophagus irregularis]